MIYKEFEYKFNHAPMSGLNGYVKIPKGHPWYNQDYDNIICEAHGGLTYASNDSDFLGEGFWIGFDTLHYGDGPEVQNEQYVGDECKKIIDQAIKAMPPKKDKSRSSQFHNKSSSPPSKRRTPAGRLSKRD